MDFAWLLAAIAFFAVSLGLARLADLLRAED